MRYARIENNRVRELIDFDPDGLFNPAIVWAACNDDAVASGWQYDAQTGFAPYIPTAEEIAAADAAAAEQADREAAAQFARLVALRGMTPVEVSGYIATRYLAPAASLADANVILAKMKDDLETLAIAVSILARAIK